MAANRQTNQRITLVMLVLASITFITLDYRGEVKGGITHVRNGIADGLSPIQRGIAAVLHPFGDVVASTFHYGSLQSQNNQLRDTVGKLTAELEQQQFASKEYNSALQLANLPIAPNVPKVLGQILSQSTSNFANDLELSVGSSSGVGKGMPVVASAGLVGQVTSESRSTSTVALLTTSGTSISVEDLRNGAIYVVSGQGIGKKLLINTTSSIASPKIGDRLVTSGQDAGLYPPDIPVGTVALVNSAPGGLNASAQVTPAVDLNQLQMVAVLQWLRPA